MDSIRTQNQKNLLFEFQTQLEKQNLLERKLRKTIGLNL